MRKFSRHRFFLLYKTCHLGWPHYVFMTSLRIHELMNIIILAFKPMAKKTRQKKWPEINIYEVNSTPYSLLWKVDAPVLIRRGQLCMWIHITNMNTSNNNVAILFTNGTQHGWLAGCGDPVLFNSVVNTCMGWRWDLNLYWSWCDLACY